MPTAAERQALAFLAGVALLGGSARAWMQHQSAQAFAASNSAVVAAETVDGQLTAVDSARNKRRGKKRGSKPVKSPVDGASASSASSPRVSGSSAVQRWREEAVQPLLIDVDIASIEELERLPRVGPALAARIVANRDSLGAFGNLAALGDVRGIGPAMLKLLKPVVIFSGRARPHQRNSTGPRRR